MYTYTGVCEQTNKELLRRKPPALASLASLATVLQDTQMCQRPPEGDPKRGIWNKHPF